MWGGGAADRECVFKKIGNPQGGFPKDRVGGGGSKEFWKIPGGAGSPRDFEVRFLRTLPLFFSEQGKQRTQMFILSKTPALFRKSEAPRGTPPGFSKFPLTPPPTLSLGKPPWGFPIFLKTHSRSAARPPQLFKNGFAIGAARSPPTFVLKTESRSAPCAPQLF